MTTHTMIRGKQKIQCAEKDLKKFVARGWQLEKPTTKSSPKSPPKTKRIKPVEAVVENQPIVSDEEHDFLQQNQGFIDDNLNQEGEN